MDRTDSKIDTPLTHGSSRHVRFKLWSRHGMGYGIYPTATEAAAMARQLWPDEEQDIDGTGDGWDIEAVL